MTQQAVSSLNVATRFQDFKAVTKMGLSLSVVFSSIAGYLLAAEEVRFSVLGLLAVGGYCMVGASNVFNQVTNMIIKIELGSNSFYTVKRKVAEFQGFDEEYKLGDTITVEHFEAGEFVDVTGTSKGKGFQGVVKRHGFGGVGQATHGQHNRLRAPGSIGAASYPARVFKGMRMAGRMGTDTVKVQNLRVLKVVADQNLIVVKGCVPGHKNAYVKIEK